MKSNREIEFKKFIMKKSEIIKSVSVFIVLIYFLFLLQITLFSRTSGALDPLSHVWGGWLIDEELYTFNIAPLLNIFMLMPICACYLILHYTIKSDHNTQKKLMIKSTVLGFAISLFIEITQLIFSLGTFQISDLVYNTLGAFLGSLIIILIKRKKATQN